MFDLLCDSTRTAEYNRFCLGRSDVLVIDEHETSPAGKAKNIKIVKSEYARAPHIFECGHVNTHVRV
jgi:hypothetical protein